MVTAHSSARNVENAKVEERNLVAEHCGCVLA